MPLSFLVPQAVEIVLFGGGFRFLSPDVPFLVLWAVVGALALLERYPRVQALVPSLTLPAQ